MNHELPVSALEQCLRVLEHFGRDFRLVQFSDRWRTLLNSTLSRLRKDARRAGRRLPQPKRNLGETGCVRFLRDLAASVENRQLAVKESAVRFVVRKLRREIRLDVRDQRIVQTEIIEADKVAALDVLQRIKDEPKLLPESHWERFVAALDLMHRKARRMNRRQWVSPRKLIADELIHCEKRLSALLDGLHPDGDYHEFKGLLAKVERAFERDIHQGRSSAEERHHHRREDAGSSPAGPDLVSKPTSLFGRFARWLLTR